MTDEQVMAEVGNFGPGMVGQYLFERAEYLRTVAINGTLGPESRDYPFQPSAAAMADLEQRGMVKAVEMTFMKPVEEVSQPTPPSDGPEDMEAVTPDVTPVKRGPGRPRKEK